MSHRRTWDRNEYEAKASQEKFSELRNEKQIEPAGTKSIQAREERLNLEENVNKVQLVPAGSGAGGRSRRGKSAGYYCSDCDETYKDSLAWLDHLNSPSHLRRAGHTLDQSRATLEDVRNRLEYLRKKHANNESKANYQIEDSEKITNMEEHHGNKKEEKKNDDYDANMAALMGITAFGTSKIKF